MDRVFDSSSRDTHYRLQLMRTRIYMSIAFGSTNEAFGEYTAFVKAGKRDYVLGWSLTVKRRRPEC